MGFTGFCSSDNGLPEVMPDSGQPGLFRTRR
jgi:hypothetical protein